MQRILFWLGLILLANWWWRKQSRAALERMQQRRNQTHDGAGMPGAPHGQARRPALAAEPMARCAVCEVHLPQSEAIVAGGRHFCCPEHARAAGERA